MGTPPRDGTPWGSSSCTPAKSTWLGIVTVLRLRSSPPPWGSTTPGPRSASTTWKRSRRNKRGDTSSSEHTVLPAIEKDCGQSYGIVPMHGNYSPASGDGQGSMRGHLSKRRHEGRVVV